MHALTSPSIPALFGCVEWESGITPNPTARPADISLGNAGFWLKPTLKAVGHCHGFANRERGRACAIFGKFFEWPELNRVKLNGANPAQLICHSPESAEQIPVGKAGEFALAIWEDRTQTLTLMTDAGQTQPLFYITSKSGVIFSTDMECLIPFCKNPDDLYEKSVEDYLCSAHDRELDRTMVREIRQIPPGSGITFTPNNIRPFEYWTPENAPAVHYKHRSEYEEHSRDLLRQCVEDRTPVEGEFVSHLSGGLDSTAITGLACEYRKALGQSLPVTFAWQPAPEPGADLQLDQHLFELAKDYFGVVGEHLPITEEIVEQFLRVDPVTTAADPTLQVELPVLQACQARGYHTILSGWGGDHVFSFKGQASNLASPLLFVFRHIRAEIQRAPSTRTSFSIKGDCKYGKWEAFRRDWSTRSGRDKQHSFLRSRAIYERNTTWSVFGARFDIRYSYPMLDHRLMEFALGCPPELYFGEDGHRNLLRCALKGVVPEEIRTNNSKAEPSRFTNTFAAYALDAAKAQPKLESGKYRKSRAAYIDVPRTIAALPAMANGDKVPYNRILKAICMLNPQ